MRLAIGRDLLLALFALHLVAMSKAKDAGP
jgi:hypothetical protein